MNLVGHKKQWDFLKNKLETDQLSHSYLLTGQEGIGKKLFAMEFAEFAGCRFPDLKIVSERNKKDPLFGDGGEIKISQIREVQNFLSYKSYNGSYKAVIIDDAEKMNQEAQSCFLKTLEEPKGKTLIFLISSKPDMLLPTIFSRCQQIKFFRPKNLPENTEKTAKEKEILKELMPVLNSSLAEKFKYVKSLDWEKQNAPEIIYVLQKHFRRLMQEKISGEGGGKNYSIGRLKKILYLAEDLNKKLMLTNASGKMALEILLMETNYEL